MEKLLKQIPIKGQSYKPLRPFSAEVKKIYALSEVDENEKTYHIELDIKNSGINYLAGQSIGIIPPGKRNENDNRPLKPRLYSIASFNNTSDQHSIDLTVKKLVYENQENEHIFGICSNYLCNTKAGDKIDIISATGRIMLLPQATNTDLILIATGTGVAPYRGFLQAAKQIGWTGEICLFLGYKTKNEALYCNHLNQDISRLCDDGIASLYLALSREEKNPAGGKMYVNHKIEQVAKKVKNIIVKENFCVYLCGIKGMEVNLEHAFINIFESLTPHQGQTKLEELKKTGRWQVEVY